MRTTAVLLLLAYLIIPALAQAEDEPGVSSKKQIEQGQPLKLQSHEPNLVGLTWDKDDVRFLDFKVSLMYPMYHDGRYKGDNSGYFYLPFPYFAFTGRFGQYIETRDSSPVIGKRFNPKLFGRYWLGSNDDYLDIIFLAHESNGQSINSEDAYLNQRKYYSDRGEDPNFADDSISRGWDYVGLTWRNRAALGIQTLSTQVEFRYFLENGPLQGEQEELNTWESYETYLQRKQVHGITIAADYELHASYRYFKGVKSSLIYQTGYKDSFDYSTVRVEFTLKFDVPFMVWYSNGYDSDLVGYYKKVESMGIAVELKSFLN